MILFPSAKINIGLRVTAKRGDGFHNIESVFYPVPLKDVIEFREAAEFKLTIYGKPVPGKLSENLLQKSWQLLHQHFNLPPVEVVLLKNIPVGSGLGGGSADAVFFIRAINDFFRLNITDERLTYLAAQLGSDCPFFIRNKPAFVTGRGETIHSCQLDLGGIFIVLIVPRLHFPTEDFFLKVTPATRDVSLREIIRQPVKRWQNLITNDFEKIAFQEYPLLAEIKAALLKRGALYASMTGTGSALYGLFETEPETGVLEKYGEIYSYKL
jgi:4-diphosphocytidyl-2-C-methyl-D-erythritol kinase